MNMIHHDFIEFGMREEPSKETKPWHLQVFYWQTVILTALSFIAFT